MIFIKEMDRNRKGFRIRGFLRDNLYAMGMVWAGRN